jgi:pimeloyl-ACP methyl ester carboxylesterase
MHRAGLEKRFLSIDDVDGTTVFCYAEKGTKVPEQPSIVFIHGFSSDKNTWVKIIKVSDYLLLCKGKYLLIHRIFLIVFTVLQLICPVMEKALDLMKNTS